MHFLVFVSYLHCSYHLTESFRVTSYFSFSPHSEIGNPCVQQRMMNRSTGQTQQFAEPGDFGEPREWKTGLEPKPSFGFGAVGTPPLLPGTNPESPRATNSKIPCEAAPESHFPAQDNEINWQRLSSFHLQTIGSGWPGCQWNGHKHLSVLLRAVVEKGVENLEHIHCLLCLFPAGIFCCSFLDKPVWATCTLRAFWATSSWLMVRRSAPKAPLTVSRWNTSATHHISLPPRSSPSPAPELGKPRQVLPARDHVLLLATELISPSLVSWLIGNDKSTFSFPAVLFLLLLGRAAPLRPQLGKPSLNLAQSRAAQIPRSLVSSLNWHLPRTPVSAKPSHITPCTPAASQSLCWGRKVPHWDANRATQAHMSAPPGWGLYESGKNESCWNGCNSKHPGFRCFLLVE